MFKYQGNKYVIDFYDWSSVNPDLYAWADVYAKVNANNKGNSKTSDDYNVLPIGPGFCLKGSTLMQTAYMAINNWLKCKKSRIDVGISSTVFFQDYIANIMRKKPLKVFVEESETKINYVFSSSTLWDHENCLYSTNKLRAIFMQVCKEKDNIDFQGGFRGYRKLSDRVGHSQYEEYKDLMDTVNWSHEDYILKTKQSTFVFNTPSVRYAHGWKLGEYLAMGKAIISTPLVNEMPAPLVHKENIFIVNNESELRDAIDELQVNVELRKLLEKGAREYYFKYLSPEKVIERVVLKKDKIH
jgi:hypothetical protein